MAAQRTEMYGDPLDSALKRERLGEVSGGGAQLSEPDSHGKRTIKWIG